MTAASYEFRVRVLGPLGEDGAERVYEGFDEEVGVEDGPRGHYVAFDRVASNFVDAVLAAL